MAAVRLGHHHGRLLGFNTQPPEGGCIKSLDEQWRKDSFNTQPPEGGCRDLRTCVTSGIGFNTQPPEGGCDYGRKAWDIYVGVSTHSHPKVAAKIDALNKANISVSTHSHPKVAAQEKAQTVICDEEFQHTATRRWLPYSYRSNHEPSLFQHTATRRWLRQY